MTRITVEEETMQAGVKRQRVLSLVDKLHREGKITFEMFGAAGNLRNSIMMELPPSEGVSSYGANVTAAEPSGKGDRAGRRLTGFEISPSGEVSYPGGRKSRRNERSLEDAIFAAVGVHDQDGKRIINQRHAEILMRVVLHTEDMPTLAKIAPQLSESKMDKNQVGPFAVSWIVTILGRLALHYKLTK